ncbi:DUF5316 domain-containing protein [Bacillus salacetis]|uniref:DUF5316 domain-containing protein n=1 Tax=Bacillus salacetis TaxID=2315464 RepID=UPI003BA1F2D4
MKLLFIGLISSILGVLLSMIIWGLENAYYISAGIAVIFLGISIISSGAMVSGDRMRANFATESAEDRRARNGITFKSALIGLPNLGIAVLVYFLFN